MRTTRTHIAQIAAVASAGLLLAACSGTPDGGSGGGGGEDVPEGATEVTFWQQNFTDEENAWYEGVVEDFNESQEDVHVSLTVVPGDAWEQRMTAAQAAGNPPDLSTMNYGGIRDAARTSQITSLADVISDEAWEDLQDNIHESITVDGEEYAYPMLVEPSAVLWYRTDLFAEAGLDGPPATWDQLIDYAEQLTTDQVFGIRLAQTAADMGWSTWGYQWNVAGHLPISDDWSEPAANDDFAPLLQAYQDLFASGALPPTDGLGYPDAATFGDGEYAMMANGSWAASQLLNDYPDLVEDVAVAPMPSFDGQPDQTTATLGGWTWVVDGNSENTEQAGAFIEWALGSDPETIVPFFEATQFSKVTARESVAEAISALPDVDSINPWNATIQEEVVPFARPEPSYPWNISLAMGEAIEAAMQGTPVEEALATASDKIQVEIENSQLAGTGN